MTGKIIELTDGTKLEIKVNFGTLYYLEKSGGTAMAKSIDTKKKNHKKISDSVNIEFAAKTIYAILRSNGRQVTFDEAIALVPMDTTAIEDLMKAFSDEIEKIKKKETAKSNMRKMQNSK